MRSLLLVLVVALGLFGQDHRSARDLWDRAYKEETVEKKYTEAIKHYEEAAARAEKRNDEELVARSYEGVARCYEKMETEDVPAALAAYQKIVEKCKRPEKIVQKAEEKLRRKGVDIWLWRMKLQIKELRDKQKVFDKKAFEEIKNQTWDKIKGLNKEAIYGLVEGLSDDEEQIREFIAHRLPEVIDESGVAQVIARLGSRPHQAGAAQALRIILDRYTDARTLYDQADWQEWLMSLGPAVTEPGLAVPDFMPENYRTLQRRADEARERGKRLVEDTRQAIADLRKRADEIRKDIPKELETEKVCQALAQIIVDESLDPTARTEALSALTSLRRIPDALVEVILKALEDPNARVREQAALVASRVNVEKGEDMHRLADRLMEIVQYEPEKQKDVEALVAAFEQNTDDELQKHLRAIAAAEIAADKDARQKAIQEYEARRAAMKREIQFKRGNVATVREKAAIALGDIGLIKSCPALIEALDDNDATVRRASYEALKKVTGLDFAFEATAPATAAEKAKLVQDLRTLAATKEGEDKDKLEKRAAEIEAMTPRQDSRGLWEKWWADTHGIEVLVNRFAWFVETWGLYAPAELYERETFLQKIKARLRFAADAEKEEKRAENLVQKFEFSKNLMLRDIQDVGKPALEQLFKFAHGKAPGSRHGRPSAAVRYWVAEALAKISEKENDSETIKKMREYLMGFQEIQADPKDEAKAGVALALGYLSRPGSDEISAVEKGLADASEVVREACARALGRIGNANSARQLIAKLKDASPKVRRESARAIGKIALRDPGVAGDDSVIEALGKLIWDEKDDPAQRNLEEKDRDDLVREHVCFAFADIASGKAVKYLIRARRDFNVNVREAAAGAFRQITAKEGGKVSEQLIEVIRNEKEKYSDRQGAALALGETADSSKVPFMVERLVGGKDNPKLREPHQTVRAGFAAALGRLGLDKKFILAALVDALMDPALEVREEAWKSLLQLTGKGGKSPLVGFEDEGDMKGKGPFDPKWPEKARERLVQKFRDWVGKAGLPD